MSCIYFIRTEYSSRCDHTDRQLSFFHGTCLNRRCLGTKKYGIIDKESILLVSCRMILRNIQLGKVVICIFNFRTFYNFIAHSNKNALNLFQRNAVGMTMTDSGFLCRKSNIDYLCFHLLFSDCFFQFLSGLFKKTFNLSSGLVYKLANLRSLLRGNVFHSF